MANQRATSVETKFQPMYFYVKMDAKNSKYAQRIRLRFLRNDPLLRTGCFFREWLKFSQFRLTLNVANKVPKYSDELVWALLNEYICQNFI